MKGELKRSKKDAQAESAAAPRKPGGGLPPLTFLPKIPPLVGVSQSQVGEEVQAFVDSSVDRLRVDAEGGGTFSITPLPLAPGAPAAAGAPVGVLAAVSPVTPRLKRGFAGTADLQSTEFKMTSSMDPRLQWAAACARRGVRRSATASSESEEIAVIARVTSPQDWEAISEVRVGAVLGQAADGYIVTGRVPASRIESVRRQPAVKSLKAGQTVRPSLAASIAETRARKDLLPTGNKTKGGAGVVVGIVDFGCDFVHRNFRKADGKTRLMGIWDQSGSTLSGGPVAYGRWHAPTAINAALKQAQPYGTLGYRPAPGSHGTHVMDIAAGNGRGTGTPGMAPEADLLFVHVAGTDIPWEGADAVGKSFGDSVQLLEAVRFIFDQAGDRPCVVNLSLGTNGGPHDGTTLVEQGLDAMLRERPNRAVVIAASNSQDDGIHASGSVPNGGTFDLVWEVSATDVTGNELEVWYPGSDRFAVELVAPDGAVLMRAEPGESRTLVHPNHPGQPLAFVANRLDDPNNHDNTVGLFMSPALPAGRWTLRLDGRVVTDGRFHAWIERDDSDQDHLNQSSFVAGRDDTHTIGSISCGQETLVVGSYDAHKPTVPLSWFSSAGPTRDGRQKPEISAPGHAVLAANAQSGAGAVLMSGTSMASPAVAGITALVLAQAKGRKRKLSVSQIRDLLIKTARRAPPGGAGWDPRYGHGRIDARAAVAGV